MIRLSMICTTDLELCVLAFPKDKEKLKECIIEVVVSWENFQFQTKTR